MDWLMQPDTTIEKFLVMLFAIALFALVMAAVLVLVDRPSLPRWVAAGGYLGPALLLLHQLRPKQNRRSMRGGPRQSNVPR